MLPKLLPFWGVIVSLAAFFLVKAIAIGLLEKTSFYKSRTAEQGWMGAVNTIAALHAVSAFGILLLYTNYQIAGILAVADGVFRWMVSYGKIKHKLPIASQDSFMAVAKWVTLIHGSTYASLVTFVIQYLLGHPAAK
jgi:hypothetical protein